VFTLHRFTRLVFGALFLALVLLPFRAVPSRAQTNLRIIPPPPERLSRLPEWLKNHNDTLLITIKTILDNKQERIRKYLDFENGMLRQLNRPELNSYLISEMRTRFISSWVKEHKQSGH
jgi:hypothetical protein